jgi:hypothetical protein
VFSGSLNSSPLWFMTEKTFLKDIGCHVDGSGSARLRVALKPQQAQYACLFGRSLPYRSVPKWTLAQVGRLMYRSV